MPTKYTCDICGSDSVKHSDLSIKVAPFRHYDLCHCCKQEILKIKEYYVKQLEKYIVGKVRNRKSEN